MNNYINELASVCKLPFNEVLNDFKIIQIGSRVIYVSNYIKIIDYSVEKVVLKIKNNTFEINGSDLFISQINKKEIVIKGNISSCGLGVINEKKSTK